MVVCVSADQITEFVDVTAPPRVAWCAALFKVLINLILVGSILMYLLTRPTSDISSNPLHLNADLNVNTDLNTNPNLDFKAL